MSKNKKTRKRKGIPLAPSREQSTPLINTPDNIQLRLDKIDPLPFSKKFLILCEGETEEAYFNGIKSNIILQRKLSALKIEVIAPTSKSKKDSLLDNNLKGLIWEAILRKKQAESDGAPFDEIWIIIDNDERNSYQLSAISLNRIKAILNRQYYSILKTFEGNSFLSTHSFEEFLLNLFSPSLENIKEVIAQTEKTNLFSEYNDTNAKILFYKTDIFSYGQKRAPEKRPDENDFDENWKAYIHKAYSCRAFEIWLILHFQRSEIVFTDSDSAVAYIQTFAPSFDKGEGNRRKRIANAYQALKPDPFAENYETMDKAQSAIDKIETAIENGAWLRQLKLEEGDKKGIEYYELDPFTDVHFLLKSLLGKEEDITWGILNQPVEDWNGMYLNYTFDTATWVLTIFIENKTNPQILINNTNINNHIWI